MLAVLFAAFAHRSLKDGVLLSWIPECFKVKERYVCVCMMCVKRVYTYMYVVCEYVCKCKCFVARLMGCVYMPGSPQVIHC